MTTTSNSAAKETNVLMDIVAHKRIELRQFDNTALPHISEIEVSTHSLKTVLATPKPSFIFECKKASPTLGAIRPDTPLDELAQLYAKHGDVVSVLTDQRYFGGSLDDIKTFRAHVDAPILAKDFFIENEQIIRARIAGADVILLMLSVLDDAQYLDLRATATQLNMDIITEIHSEDELARAIELDAEIIGINNRDLKTLKTDLNVTKQLTPKIPKGRLIISLSGINNRNDVLELAPFVNGFLVGSSIMSAPDMEAKIIELLYGQVKVCGLTSLDDAIVAKDLGASYGGLIFVPESPRYINHDTALNISENCDLPMVGVFAGSSLENILKAVDDYKLCAVQLHGSIDEKLNEALMNSLPDVVKLWQSHAIKNDEVDLTKLSHAIHLDSFDEKLHGGTGKSFNWQLLSNFPGKERLVLAGGLGPKNILAAAHTGASILDVNSSVEHSPGKKDPQKLKDLFNILRNLDKPLEKQGYFGEFGGTYVPEILVPVLDELEAAYMDAQADPVFRAELSDLLKNYAGRETPLTLCRNLCTENGVKIYLKREDLLHGGAHKTNQVLAQALLAKRMGKKRIIAETGAGQHGVAVALASALLGLDAHIYMGAEDVARQQANVYRMELFGATIIPVNIGSATLKDAVNEAMRDWTASYASTHYILGTAAGPHPFPTIVRDFQRIIGDEARAQILDREGRLPDVAVACVGGGSNAIGLFTAFLNDVDVALVGVEPAGEGIDTGKHGATLNKGSNGVLHGSKTYILQDEHGQISPSHSISAGLDYPAVGPEHVHLMQSGRATYETVDDNEALAAFRILSRTEGIIPALESAHALAHALKLATTMPKDSIILVNLSGRGDKDLEHVRALGTSSAGENP